MIAATTERAANAPVFNNDSFTGLSTFWVYEFTTGVWQPE